MILALMFCLTDDSSPVEEVAFILATEWTQLLCLWRCSETISDVFVLPIAPQSASNTRTVVSHVSRLESFVSLSRYLQVMHNVPFTCFATKSHGECSSRDSWSASRLHLNQKMTIGTYPDIPIEESVDFAASCLADQYPLAQPFLSLSPYFCSIHLHNPAIQQSRILGETNETHMVSEKLAENLTV